MKGRVLLVGPVGVGKSSLLNALRGTSEQATKTQAVIYNDCGIDIPGEYLENPSMYRYIISLSQEASVILMLQDGDSEKLHYPPRFASSFNVPVIGVVTKTDLPTCDIFRAQSALWQAGIKDPIYCISAVTGLGMEALINRLEQLKVNHGTKSI